MFHFRAIAEAKFVTVITYTADYSRITPNTLAGDMVDCVGGKWHRASQTYRLSLGQFRLMCDLIDAGFLPELNPAREYGAEMDRFFNPTTGEELDRKQARARFAPVTRCKKTLELAL